MSGRMYWRSFVLRRPARWVKTWTARQGRFSGDVKASMGKDLDGPSGPLQRRTSVEAGSVLQQLLDAGLFGCFFFGLLPLLLLCLSFYIRPHGTECFLVW